MVRKGDLLFVHGTSWCDVAIEDITHSQFSHVAGFIGDHELVEAQGFHSVRFRSPNAYKGESAIYTCDSLTDDQRTQIASYVIGEIGDHYDYLLIGWEALRYLFHWTIPFAEPFHSRICSTLYSDAYREVGVDLCPGIRYPSPGDLAESKLLRKVCSY